MSNKLYIGNLSYQAKDQDLFEAFQAYGEIEDAKVIEDRMTGRSRGFGFVSFVSAEDAQKALEMDGKDLKGRAIAVSIARDRPPREGGGGFGGGAPRGPGGGGGGRGGRDGGSRYSRSERYS